MRTPDCPIIVGDTVGRIRSGWDGRVRRLDLPAGVVALSADSASRARSAVWSLCVEATVTQPQGRDALFQEQDTFDPDGALEITVRLPDAEGEPLLCLYQHKEWWMRPAWGQAGEVPARTQLVVWRGRAETPRDDARRDDGANRIGSVPTNANATAVPDGVTERWHALLAVSGTHSRADIAGVADGELRITVSSNRPGRIALSDLAAVVGSADDPDAAVDSCVELAADRLGLRLRGERPFPPELSGLGWCTWDSLGQEVNEAAIIEKMEEFRAKAVPVSWVLIDDGWSLVDRVHATLVGFDVDERRFPQGLAHTVQLLKSRYGVRHVGVWQAFQGYWSGVDSDGPVAREAGAHLERLSNGCLIPGSQASQAFGFWNLWDSGLRRAGVDFVKVDSQSSASVMTRGSEDYGEATIGRHDGLDAAVSLHFGGALINCMGMAPEDYWHRRISPITRTSDDFLPHEPGSLAEHIIQNAYCSLLMGELYHCDWDMFWTDHPHACAHALLRVLSGGPVYTSDALGSTDAQITRPLMLADGTVPRPDGPARPARACLLHDPVHVSEALGVVNQCGAWRVTAFVGLRADTAQTALVGDLGADSWVYDWEERSVTWVRRGGVLSRSVPYGRARLFYICPGADPARGSGILAIGLVEKVLAPACIEWRYEDTRGLDVTLAEPGLFGFIDPDVRCVEVVCDGRTLPVERHGVLCVVRCPGREVRISCRANTTRTRWE